MGDRGLFTCLPLLLLLLGVEIFYWLTHNLDIGESNPRQCFAWPFCSTLVQWATYYIVTIEKCYYSRISLCLCPDKAMWSPGSSNLVSMTISFVLPENWVRILTIPLFPDVNQTCRTGLSDFDCDKVHWLVCLRVIETADSDRIEELVSF